MKDLKFPQSAQQIALVAALDALRLQESQLAQLETDLIDQAEQFEWHSLIDALRVLRGVDYITAITLVAEIGDLRRFPSARQLMAYVGLVPSEYSSGGCQRRGAITKTGNAAVRQTLIESAWAYRYPPPAAQSAKRLRACKTARLGRTKTTVRALPNAIPGRQGQKDRSDCRGAGAARLHLGHRLS